MMLFLPLGAPAGRPPHPNAPGLCQSATGRQQMEACQPLGHRLFRPTRTVKIKIKAASVLLPRHLAQG